MPNTPHHANFFSHSTAIFCVLDFDGKFKEANPALGKALGLPANHLLARSFLDFVHPDDRAATQNRFDQLSGGMVSTSFSNRFRHRKGDYLRLLWEVTAAASQEDAFYAVAMNITGRERPSIADEIVSVLNSGVIIQHADGSIGACNPSAERIVGLPADKMFSWTLIDANWQAIREDGTPFPSEEHPAISTLRTGKAYSNVIMGVNKPDGTLTWLRISTHPLWRDGTNTPYAVVISFSDISESYSAQRTLSRSVKPRRVSSVQATGDFWIWDLKTNVINFSARWKKMLGYPEGQIMANMQAWQNRIHPDDSQKVLNDIRAHLNGLTPRIENTHRLRCKNGDYRWIRCRALAVHDAKGSVRHVAGVHTDITEYREMERKLEAIENKYRQVLDAEFDAVFSVEVRTDRIVEANKAASKIYGYRHGELLAITRMALSAQVEEHGKSVKKRGSLQRYQKTKHGDVFPAEINISPYMKRGMEMLMVTVRNDMVRQRVETALWESQAKYRQLFESTSDAIIIFEAETQRILEVNNTAVDMYGYAKKEWQHLTTDDISAEPTRSRSAFYNIDKRVRVMPLRWHKKKNGTVFPVEITMGNTFIYQGGSLICATLRDITERRAADEALRKEKDFINTLIQASPAFFFAMEPDGKIRMMNKAMFDTLGYTSEEVMGKDFFADFVAREERTAAAAEFAALAKSKRPLLTECRVQAKKGKSFLVEWHGRAVTGKNGALDYLFNMGIDVTERSEAQGQQHLFKAVIEASEEAIAISDTDNRSVYVNPAYEKMFGRPPRGPDLNERYPPESLEVIKREIIPALARGEGWAGSLDTLDMQGNAFPVWKRVDAVRSVAGDILFKFELMHDISEDKRMWETVRAQWEEYQLLFNSVPVMIWRWDRENRLLHKNRAAAEAFTLTGEARRFNADNPQVIQSGRTEFGIVECFPYSNKGKRLLRTGKIPYRDKTGNITGLVVFALDISDCNRFTVPAATEEERLRLLPERLPALVSAFNAEGNFIVWNQACVQATGYSSAEILNNPQAMEKLFPSAKKRHEMLERLGLPEPQSFRYGKHPIIRSKDGSFEPDNASVNKDFRDWEHPVRCKDGRSKTIRWASIAEKCPVQGWHTWVIGEDLATDTEVSGEEALLTSIFELTKIGICLIDAKGNFIRVNQAYAEMYGYSPEMLAGQPLTALLPRHRHNEAMQDYFNLLVSTAEPVCIDKRNEQHRAGHDFDARAILNQVVLDDGRCVLFTVLTEHKSESA